MPVIRWLRAHISSNRDSRLLLQAQLPFVGAVGGIALFLLLTDRSLFFRTEIAVAFLITAVSTVAALFVPWRLIAPQWLILVALLDVVTVAILRDATDGVLQGVGILIVFPVLWLAYGFTWRVLVIALLGSLLVVFYPFIRAGALPQNAGDWGNVVVVPTTVFFMAIAVHIAAVQLKAHQRQLRASQATSGDRKVTLEAVTDSIDASVMIFDTDDHPILLNQSARDLIAKSGYTGDAADDGELAVYESDGTTPYALDTAHMSGGIRTDDVVDKLLVVGEADDDPTAISATSRTIVRDNGDLVGTVIVAQDVSAFVNAAHDREQFLQTMSHELRTPLTSILGYLEVIADTIDADNVGIASELDVIKRNSDRLNALISALLTVSAEPRPMSLRNTDLMALVEESVATFERNAELAKVSIETDELDLVTAECDVERVQQIVNNLISNAIKYTPPSGTVRVALSRAGDDAVLEVSDSGQGIDSGEQPLVFDQFFRGRAARQQAVQGVGVGLTIVKSAAEAHGGSVHLSSEPGVGTTVKVRIPLVAASVA